ncbi:hypothetical protein MBRA1_003038 [Malassezia brasiliensis]|uniref:BZIP domain-containing protein n=1 Tax=Malassezia brasiliensis TaxID=1821822 RepID=A0AAF0DV78_9BASI|nr:hypothetical protein MBRA1_003038 [Malassezia brasiliensis]
MTDIDRHRTSAAYLSEPSSSTHIHTTSAIPPSPGASQEELFVRDAQPVHRLTEQRYHLNMELQKLGPAPDSALLDRLVKQHYPLIQKQCEAAALSQTPMPSLAENAADAVNWDAAALTPPASVDGGCSPVDDWGASDAEGTRDFTSNLLNLDFGDESAGTVGSPLFAPPFPDPIASSNEASFETLNAFRDATPHATAKTPPEAINPQLVLPASPARPAEAPADVGPSPFAPAPATDVVPSIKREVPALEPIAEQPETVDGPTFTAFTPMRLDRAASPTRAPKPGARSVSPEADSWRPSAEEYNKLSSKEKRQLRNKISARNFRNRRKEYITLLEEQVQERDKLIDNLRDQVASLRLQNTELTNQLRAQQSRGTSAVDVSKLLGALQRTQDADAPASHASPRLSAPGATLVPNMRKDVSPSPRPMSPPNVFWGGVPHLATSAVVA